MNFSIVISIYNQYELLRQCMESIQHHILNEVEEIIIVDDYSDPNSKLREYENYLDTIDKIKVIKSDEYRVSVHCSEHHITVAQRRNDTLLKDMNMGRTTRGHGYALQIGINEAKTKYVLCLDADCVILKAAKGMFNEIEDLFTKYTRVECIGQVAGLMTDEIIETEKLFRFKVGTRPIGLGGCPGSPAFAKRVREPKGEGITDYRANPMHIMAKPTHRGWALTAYCTRLFEHGYTTLNYPVFSKKKIFHVGGGILNAARFGGDGGIDSIKWGMLKDGNQYGGRRGTNIVYDWYQGRYILDMNTKDYKSLLREKYNAPFNQLQPPFDESRLKVAEEETKPERI